MYFINTTSTFLQIPIYNWTLKHGATHRCHPSVCKSIWNQSTHFTISPPKVAPAPNIAAFPNLPAMPLSQSWCFELSGCAGFAGFCACCAICPESWWFSMLFDRCSINSQKVVIGSPTRIELWLIWIKARIDVLTRLPVLLLSHWSSQLPTAGTRPKCETEIWASLTGSWAMMLSNCGGLSTPESRKYCNSVWIEPRDRLTWAVSGILLIIRVDNYGQGRVYKQLISARSIVFTTRWRHPL